MINQEVQQLYLTRQRFVLKWLLQECLLITPAVDLHGLLLTQDPSCTGLAQPHQQSPTFHCTSSIPATLYAPFLICPFQQHLLSTQTFLP